MKSSPSTKVGGAADLAFALDGLSKNLDFSTRAKQKGESRMPAAGAYVAESTAGLAAGGIVLWHLWLRMLTHRSSSTAPRFCHGWPLSSFARPSWYGLAPSASSVCTNLSRKDRP